MPGRAASRCSASQMLTVENGVLYTLNVLKAALLTTANVHRYMYIFISTL